MQTPHCIFWLYNGNHKFIVKSSENLAAKKSQITTKAGEGGGDFLNFIPGIAVIVQKAPNLSTVHMEFLFLQPGQWRPHISNVHVPYRNYIRYDPQYSKLQIYNG